MSWGEAFGRAFSHALALIGFTVLSGVIIGLGIGFTFTEYDSGVVFGLLFIVVGSLIFLLSGTATAIKAITDAVTDHVETRLSTSSRQVPTRPPKVEITE